MEMQTFLAQSPDAARVRSHITAATLSLGLVGRSITQPRRGASTTADFHLHLTAPCALAGPERAVRTGGNHRSRAAAGRRAGTLAASLVAMLKRRRPRQNGPGTAV